MEWFLVVRVGKCLSLQFPQTNLFDFPQDIQVCSLPHLYSFLEIEV